MRGKWTEILCSFVGWDCDILNECSAASRKTLHRYAGAIVLLMLLWFYIGYGMASRYFKMDSVWSQLGVAAVFSFIVWIVERQIILIVGRNKAVGRVRIVLAVIMALLGATIIDQTLFGKDIDAQMAKVIEARTDERFAYRKRIIEDELARSRMELDSLETTAALLSDEIGKRPMIKTVLYTKSATGHLDSLGNAVMATGYIEEMVPNPKSQDRDRVNRRIDDIRSHMTSLVDRQQAMREEIRNETKADIGLLTELEITFSDEVLFSGWASGLFYLAVFLFFLLIETLVVTGKIYSQPCDYEVLVEHQQEKRRRQICSLLEERPRNE